MVRARIPQVKTPLPDVARTVIEVMLIGLKRRDGVSFTLRDLPMPRDVVSVVTACIRALSVSGREALPLRFSGEPVKILMDPLQACFTTSLLRLRPSQNRKLNWSDGNRLVFKQLMRSCHHLQL